LQSDLDRAVALSVLLLLMSGVLLLALRYSPVGLFWKKSDAPLHRP
jgi:ABC-type sulfate transport system permease component